MAVNRSLPFTRRGPLNWITFVWVAAGLLLFHYSRHRIHRHLHRHALHRKDWHSPSDWTQVHALTATGSRTSRRNTMTRTISKVSSIQASGSTIGKQSLAGVDLRDSSSTSSGAATKKSTIITDHVKADEEVDMITNSAANGADSNSRQGSTTEELMDATNKLDSELEHVTGFIKSSTKKMANAALAAAANVSGSSAQMLDMHSAGQAEKGGASKLLESVFQLVESDTRREGFASEMMQRNQVVHIEKTLRQGLNTGNGNSLVMITINQQTEEVSEVVGGYPFTDTELRAVLPVETNMGHSLVVDSSHADGNADQDSHLIVSNDALMRLDSRDEVLGTLVDDANAVQRYRSQNYQPQLPEGDMHAEVNAVVEFHVLPGDLVDWDDDSWEPTWNPADGHRPDEFAPLPVCRKVLWFTSFAGDIDNTIVNIKAAVLSAKRHAPSVIPVVLWESTISFNSFTSWLQTNGVYVKRHAISFLRNLANEVEANRKPEWWLHRRAAFMWIDSHTSFDSIREAFRKDNSVDGNFYLYTDSAVLFQNDLTTCNFGRPTVLSAGKAGFPANELSTGVLYINTEGLAKVAPALIRHGEERLWAWANMDKGWLSSFLKDIKVHIPSLPDYLLWKPYWGRGNNTIVVHFDGLRPGPCLKCFVQNPLDFKSVCPCWADFTYWEWGQAADSCKYYTAMYFQHEDTLAAANPES